MHLPGNITGAKVKVVGDFTDEALIKSKETTSAFLHSTRNLETAVPKFQRGETVNHVYIIECVYAL